jgi:hypothetical protein
MSSINDVDMTVGDIPQIFTNCFFQGKYLKICKSDDMCPLISRDINHEIPDISGQRNSATAGNKHMLLTAFADHHLSHILHLTRKNNLIPSTWLPSGYVKIAIENDQRNSGFTH